MNVQCYQCYADANAVAATEAEESLDRVVLAERLPKVERMLRDRIKT